MHIAGWKIPDRFPGIFEEWLRDGSTGPEDPGPERFVEPLGRLETDGLLRILRWSHGASAPGEADPLGPLRPCLRLAAPSSEVDVTACGRQLGTDMRVLDLLVLSAPGREVSSWRPTTPLDDAPPLLPQGALTLVTGCSPEELVPDLEEIRPALATARVEPEDASMVLSMLRKAGMYADEEYPSPSWDDASTLRSHGVDAALKLLSDGLDPGIARLERFPGGGKRLLTVGGPPQGVSVVATIWAGMDEDGESAAVAFATTMISGGSSPPGEETTDVWERPVAPADPPRTLTGQALDRLGEVGSNTETWNGQAIRRKHDDQRAGEEPHSESRLVVRYLGDVHFPSGSVTLCDPSPPRGRNRATVDIRLSYPGPFAVFAAGIDVDGAPEDFGALLVRLADGRPRRWVAAPAVENDRADASPEVDTGACAITDTAAADRLAEQDGFPAPAGWLLERDGPPVKLLSTVNSDEADAVIMTAIGGDVPTWAVIGLDDQDRPVALALDTWDISHG